MNRLYVLFTLSFWLCAASLFGQVADSTLYDFRDGSIHTAMGTADGSLKLSGTIGMNGGTYGIDMKAGSTIKLAVSQSSTIRFMGSQYSSIKVQGTTSAGADLGTQASKVATDLGETYDFVYSGAADTLTFTALVGEGSDVYLPYISVIPTQNGGDANLTAPVKNLIYSFNLRDGSIIPTNTPGNVTVDQGLFKIESGPSNGYGYNGADHGSVLKTGNVITLKVAGNSYIKLGGCIYSGGSVAMSSTTGGFDKTTIDTKAPSEYHTDGTTLDILYAGTAGEVMLTFTGTTYVPNIEVVPVPYAVELASWTPKSGTITINGTEIGLTAGATTDDAATVTVSAGTLISATKEIASIRIDLGGNALSSFTPTLTGNISSVTFENDSMLVAFADSSSKPYGFIIEVADNSATVQAQAGKTYSYSLADGSELPQTGYSSLRYATFVSSDGLFTIKSNTEVNAGRFGYHDNTHGAVLFVGNSIDFVVAGNATIGFITCQYGGAADAVFEFRNSNGDLLGSTAASKLGEGVASNFSYVGPAGVVTATLTSPGGSTGEFYMHGLSVENAAAIQQSNGKTDVWDFGATQLDAATYNNQLTANVINGWYDAAITPGTSGNVLPSFTVGVLSWVGGSNDRLRTSNEALTRYDGNVSTTEYAGKLYVNSSASTGRFIGLTLSADDEVTVVASAQSGGGQIHFEYIPDPAAQNDVVAVTSNVTELKFVAKAAGSYHIYDANDKPSYYRVYRKDAEYVTITGNLDVTGAAGLASNYGLSYTNAAGKTWPATISSGSYSVTVPVGYNYSLSLTDANGYIISTATSLATTAATTNLDVTIVKVELYTVSGSVTGLGTQLSNLTLSYTPDASANTIFIPEPVIDANAATYTVQLEPGIQYTMSAKGVNDYYMPTATITIAQANQTADVVFEAKPVYNVTVTANDLTAEQLAGLGLTFTNLNEPGYAYTFNSINNITLRDGVYTLTYSGLNLIPLKLALTSNLAVNGADITKVLSFVPISVWSFNEKVLASTDTAYNGLLLTGTSSNEVAKGHLSGRSGSTLKVPVKPNQKVKVSYYYAADFTINGGAAITTQSGSTTSIEYVEYVYTGSADGFVTITFGSGTSYLTEIEVVHMVAYQAEITVGAGKDYPTIKAALQAIAKMDRPNQERVTVSIDPGNYEEMLVINLNNITLKNASATPSIALANKGVDIDANAVRITSYYGYGYSYYSQGNDNKWNADVLRVNKENGYLSYRNESGTTNGSYWDATVVVLANGFRADNIIFENSFNQYISQKEANDLVVMWESGSKGQRPTTAGNTDVQNRSFVERAAAIAVANADKVVLNNCRVVGRQDSFYGGGGSRLVAYKGAMMGAVDYIFGAMTAVFYQTELVMNVSDDAGDQSYLTAAQHASGRGYLMYECIVTSAKPGIENASQYRANPGYFGRPWAATTSEVVFFNTKVETSNNPAHDGESLIAPAGWASSLSGESPFMYEFGTNELSGVDNSTSRASWSDVLSSEQLADGTAITTFNFTKGADGWDPIPELITNDIPTGVSYAMESDIKILAYGKQVSIENLDAEAQVTVYNINGSIAGAFTTNGDTTFTLQSGFWIVTVATATEQQAAKIAIP